MLHVHFSRGNVISAFTTAISISHKLLTSFYNARYNNFDFLENPFPPAIPHYIATQPIKNYYSPDSPLVLASGTDDLLLLLQIFSSIEPEHTFVALVPTAPPILPQLLTLSSCSLEKLFGLNRRSPALRRLAAIAVAPLPSVEQASKLSLVRESAAIRADSKLPRQEKRS